MAVKHQQSTSITNRQATIVVPNPTGAGAGGKLINVSDSVVLAASQDAASTVRILRVPTNAKVKQVILVSQAQTQGTFDLGVYYPTDGPTGKADLLANTIISDFFAQDIDLTSAYGPTDVTSQSTQYTIDLWNKPLWQALALASDPGGEFDIVLSVVTTAVTTGLGIVGLSVNYVE